MDAVEIADRQRAVSGEAGVPQAAEDAHRVAFGGTAVRRKRSRPRCAGGPARASLRRGRSGRSIRAGLRQRRGRRRLRPSPPTSGCRSRPGPRARRIPAHRRRSRRPGRRRRRTSAGRPRCASAGRSFSVVIASIRSIARAMSSSSGTDVVRLDRIGIGRRAEKQAGVGLDVPALVDADERRPARHRDARRWREDEGGAALRHQPDRLDAGETGDPVAPRARRVHDHRCLPAPGGAGVDRASRRRARERAHLRIAHDLAAARRTRAGSRGAARARRCRPRPAR